MEQSPGVGQSFCDAGWSDMDVQVHLPVPPFDANEPVTQRASDYSVATVQLPAAAFFGGVSKDDTNLQRLHL